MRAQSPLQFESAPKTPLEDKNEDLLKKHLTDKNLNGSDKYEENDKKYECTFQVPSKPIDINVPSSSKRATRPPQRSDSETSSTHMEVDEVSAEKLGGNTDIDSGIENMEVCGVVSLLRTCAFNFLMNNAVLRQLTFVASKKVFCF